MNNTLHNRQFPLGIIHNDDKIIVITSQGTHYATTYDPSAARLISAAPDLLAAALRSAGFMEKRGVGAGEHDLRVAIAKATGMTFEEVTKASLAAISWQI